MTVDISLAEWRSFSLNRPFPVSGSCVFPGFSRDTDPELLLKQKHTGAEGRPPSPACLSRLVTVPAVPSGPRKSPRAGCLGVDGSRVHLSRQLQDGDPPSDSDPRHRLLSPGAWGRATSPPGGREGVGSLNCMTRWKDERPRSCKSHRDAQRR